MARRKSEAEQGDDVLKEMVANLNELPTEVLEQLLKNLDEIEKYNKAHGIGPTGDPIKKKTSKKTTKK